MLYKLLFGSIILTALDSFYISIIKKRFLNMIKNIQGSNVKINIFGLLMSYFFLIMGLYFIFKNKINYKDAFLFGLIIYGVYDMTNMALFNKWSLFISIIDILWGGILFSSTTYLSNLII